MIIEKIDIIIVERKIRTHLDLLSIPQLGGGDITINYTYSS